MMGLMDPIHGGAQLLSEGAKAIGIEDKINQFNNYLVDKGVPLARVPEGGVSQMVAEREKQYQQSRDDEGMDWGRIGGNVVSGLIPAAKGLQVAKTAPVLGGMLGGASASGMMPVTEGDFGEEKTKQVAIGGVTGGFLPAIGQGVSRVISPQISKVVQGLQKEGVRLTPGQIMGGTAKRAEEAARSIPIMGDAITAAHKRGIHDFNKVALNRVLKPIGEKVDDIGYKGIEKAKAAVSKAYDDALNLKVAVVADEPFVHTMGKINQMSENLKPDSAKQLNKILKNELYRRFTPDNRMSAQSFKEVDSALGREAAGFMKSTVRDDQQVGAALKEVQTALRSMVARGNPEFSKKLSAADEAFANMVRVERAAGMQGAKGGIFTPNQLESSVRATDQSLRKGKFAQGKSLMQDLATAGDEVIAQKLPSSGTAERLMLGGGVLGAGAYSPVIPALAIGGAGLYTKPMQSLARVLMTSRPQQAKPVADLVRELTKYATPGVAAAVAGQ
jgi:hypothetical protein